MPHVVNHTGRSSTYSQSSSEDFALNHLRDHSRSASGTSETQYDALDLPPKAFMDEYIQNGYDIQSPSDRGLRNAPDLIDHDPTSLHLLVENAAAESQFFDILSPEQLEALRVEESAISKQVEALRRKLYLESKVRTATQSLSRLSSGKQANGGYDSTDLEASNQKCEELARELWRAEKRLSELREQHLRHTAGVLQLQHQKSSRGGASMTRNGPRDSFSDWFDGFGSHHLANTIDGIIDIPGGSSGEADAVLSSLWDVLCEEERHIPHHAEYHNEAFSHEAFSNKVERLCRRARELQEEMHFSQQQQESESEKEKELMNQIAQYEDDLQSMRSQLGKSSDLERQLTEQSSKFEKERTDLESEVVRLQTEVTVARAELDGAYGSRAQRAAEVANSPEVREKLDELHGKNEKLLAELQAITAKSGTSEARVGVLEKELRELVTEHESLVQDGVKAEREREGLETTIDELRDRVEAMQTKIAEDKVMNMARSPVVPPIGGAGFPPPSPGARIGGEGSSMGMMRNEFKQIMRDARSEHFKALRAEQEERRKLESIIRQLRKDQGTASPASLAPPGTPGKAVSKG